MEDILIEAKGITKIFSSKTRSFKALDGVDLAIERGDFVALEGPSGSGKSTLLSIIGLLDQQSAGEYYLAGHSVHSLSAYQRAALRNQHVGWIFQNFNLINDMSVIENIILPLRYHPSIPRIEQQQRASQALEKVDIAEKASSYPSELSGGQQQRVAIARALVTEPDLILADEPTGNLDSVTAKQILKLLENLNRQGSTILMVTHDADIASRCRRRLHLHDGRWT